MLFSELLTRCLSGRLRKASRQSSGFDEQADRNDEVTVVEVAFTEAPDTDEQTTDTLPGWQFLQAPALDSGFGDGRREKSFQTGRPKLGTNSPKDRRYATDT